MNQTRVLRWLVLLILCGVGGFGFLGGCSSEGRKCESIDDCDPGFYCRSDGECFAGCRLSIECPAGEVCSANQCFKAKKDADKDGFSAPLDCDDTDPLINQGVSEICGNKKDDNCNGQVDEETCVKVDCRPGDTRECYEGKETTLTFPGTHCKKGRQVCGSSGVWGDCQAQVLPAPENCDNQDNDCNGKVDDGEGGKPLSRKCYGGLAQTRNQGICKEGVQTCLKGVWGGCAGEIAPSKEECNGKDSDCDGSIDNVKGVGDNCDAGGKGACQKGRNVCDIQAKKVVCKANFEPKDESCGDKIDNDCNGLVDDGCPYVGRKVATVSSFPHYISIRGTIAAISLKQTKQVLFYDLSKDPPTKLREVSLSAAPHGIQMDATHAYATSEKTLFKVEISSGQVEEVSTFAQSSHAGSLLLKNGRVYTRREGTNAKAEKTLAFCRTELATKQTSCAELTGPFLKVGLGVGLWGVYGLSLSGHGVHFVDILQLKEEPKQLIKITQTPYDIAIDTQTKQAIITSVEKEKAIIIDLSQGKVTATLEVMNDQGKFEKPGHVVAADGLAYVAHENGDSISVIDLLQRKVTRTFKICLAPHGIALGPKDPKKGQLLWVACPGDNSIWSVYTGP